MTALVSECRGGSFTRIFLFVHICLLRSVQESTLMVKCPLCPLPPRPLCRGTPTSGVSVPTPSRGPFPWYKKLSNYRTSFIHLFSSLKVFIFLHSLYLRIRYSPGINLGPNLFCSYFSVKSLILPLGVYLIIVRWWQLRLSHCYQTDKKQNSEVDNHYVWLYNFLFYYTTDPKRNFLRGFLFFSPPCIPYSNRGTTVDDYDL